MHDGYRGLEGLRLDFLCVRVCVDFALGFTHTQGSGSEIMGFGFES